MTRTIIAVTLIATLSHAVKLYSSQPMLMEAEQNDFVVAPPMSVTDSAMLLDSEHMMAMEDDNERDGLTSMIENATADLLED